MQKEYIRTPRIVVFIITVSENSLSNVSEFMSSCAMNTHLQLLVLFRDLVLTGQDSEDVGFRKYCKAL